MSRSSIFSRKRIQTKQVKYTVPEQLDVDLATMSKITGWNQGELITMAVLRMFKVVIPKWNERYQIHIPEPLSLRQPEFRDFTSKDLLETIERMSLKDQKMPPTIPSMFRRWGSPDGR